MNMTPKQLSFVLGCFFFAALLCFLTSSCHALIVADKLYYQGSVGKTTSQPTDTTINTITREIYD